MAQTNGRASNGGFHVLQPAAIGRLELRNRFFRSASWDAMADDSGMVTDRSIKLFSDLAGGGVGLIVTGYAFISRQGQPRGWQYGIHCDEMIPGLQRVTQAVHDRGGKIALQIVHAGLRTWYLPTIGQIALAPSVVQSRVPHRAMTDAEIEQIIDDFAAAAARVKKAGFDAVQLHGAHGYIFTEFLSPLMNRRQDRWGGSLENRQRFLVETVRRIKAAVGRDFPLLMKFGIADDDPGGTTLDEGIAALQAMADAGLDAVEISGGIGSGKQGSTRVFVPGTEVPYYRERAAIAKRAIRIPLAVVGGIRDLDTAESIVASGDADFVSMSRPFVREPGLINRWLSGDHERAKCISCAKCQTLVHRGIPLECGEDRLIRLRQQQKTLAATALA